MAAFVHDIVGLLHASMAIFNAWLARDPVLVLGGTGPVDADHRRPWIDWIHTANVQGTAVRDFVKWDDQPASVEAAVESLIRGYNLIQAEPRGPVYVCFDTDAQEAEARRAVRTSRTLREVPAAVAAQRRPAGTGRGGAAADGARQPRDPGERAGAVLDAA